MPYRKFVKDLASIGLVTVFRTLRGIILLPVITKLLGAEQYGTWTQLTVTLGLITPLVLLGLPQALLRYVAGEKDKKKMQNGVYSVLIIVLLLSFLAAVGFVLLAEPIGSFFQAPPLFIYLLSLLITFEVLSIVLLFALRALQQIGKYAAFIMFQTLGEVFFAVLLLLLGYGLLGVILSFLVIHIITFIMLLWLVIRKIGFRMPTFSHIGQYFSFGFPLFISNISYWIVTSSDRYLIGFFLGILSVGYYAPAYAIGNMLNIFVVPFAVVLPGVFAKLYDEKSITQIQTFMRYSLTYFLFLAIPAIFGLSLLSHQLLIIFSTQEIADNSYFVIPFVLLSILLYGVYIIISQNIHLVKKTKTLGSIWLLAALLNIGLNIFFIPLFGLLGAAITTLAVYVLAALLTYYYASRKLTVSVDWIAIGKSLLASIVMALFIFLINPHSIAVLILTIIGASLLYVVLLILLGAVQQKEIRFLKELISTKPSPPQH